jgi:hypothetical protein
MDCEIVDVTAPGHVPVLRPMRVLLVAFGVLTFLAVAALFVRPETTDRYFAWTIKPPLTAAFLGAAYAAGCTLVVLSVRATAWAHARAPVVTILLFTVLTLVATVVHLDRFHFGSPGLIARGAAWLWTSVYLVVPVVLVVLLVLQWRAPGEHPPRQRPMPRWLAVVLAAQAVVLLAAGAVLFVRPGVLDWPWALTALTSRAVGAWLASFGVAAALAVAERDLVRLRSSAIAYLVFAVCELLALIRFVTEVAWQRPISWLYLAFLLVAVITAAAGIRLARLTDGSRAEDLDRPAARA